MNIDVRIDRLVLDGVTIPPGEEALFRTALEEELVRLLAAGGPGSRALEGGNVPALRAGGITWPAEGGAAHAGRDVARAVYGALGASPAGPSGAGKTGQ